jgi:hypothetical protein
VALFISSFMVANYRWLSQSWLHCPFFHVLLGCSSHSKEQVIKYMRHCLLRKKSYDVQEKGSALVAWSKICRPKFKVA